MSKMEIQNKVSDATVKLELMRTLLTTILEMFECEVGTPNEAMMFAYQKDKIRDLVHIVFDGVVEIDNMLCETEQTSEESEAAA